MKERIKRFWKKHENTVMTVAVAASGMYLGYQYSQLKYNIGLSMCMLAEPELKPLLESAVEKCKQL